METGATRPAIRNHDEKSWRTPQKHVWKTDNNIPSLTNMSHTCRVALYFPTCIYFYLLPPQLQQATQTTQHIEMLKAVSLAIRSHACCKGRGPGLSFQVQVQMFEHCVLYNLFNYHNWNYCYYYYYYLLHSLKTRLFINLVVNKPNPNLNCVWILNPCWQADASMESLQVRYIVMLWPAPPSQFSWCLHESVFRLSWQRVQSTAHQSVLQVGRNTAYTTMPSQVCAARVHEAVSLSR